VNLIMEQTVIGIFKKSDEARNAVQELYRKGFSQAEIDVTTSGVRTADASDRDSDDSFGERVERFFRNLFDNESESTRYATAARNGTMVTVRAQSTEEATRASQILDDYGAVDVDESYNRGTANNSYSDRTQEDRPTPGDTSSRSIPIIEEELEVGKREVNTGRVRVRSRIIEKPVEETLRLRDEQISVERTPTDRPATEGDFSTFQEGEIEMKETEEIPVVKKEARVVEEVRLNKDVREREETIRDTVKRTDIEIDETDEKDRDTRSDKKRL
jgi:stress response protein YsnF